LQIVAGRKAGEAFRITIHEALPALDITISPGCTVCLEVCQPRVLDASAAFDPSPEQSRHTLISQAKQRCDRCERFFVSPHREKSLQGLQRRSGRLRRHLRRLAICSWLWKRSPVGPASAGQGWIGAVGPASAGQGWIGGLKSALQSALQSALRSALRSAIQ